LDETLVLGESQTIQMKAMEHFFNVAPSCKQFKVVLTFQMKQKSGTIQMGAFEQFIHLVA